MSTQGFNVSVRGVKEAEAFTVEQTRLFKQTLEAATNVAMQLGIERLAKLASDLVPEHLTARGSRWVQRRRNRIVEARGRAAWRWRYIESARRFHRRRKATAAQSANAIWGRFGVRGKPVFYETGTEYQFWVRRHWRTLRNGKMIQVPGSKETLAPLTDRATKRRARKTTRPYMRRVNKAGPIWPRMTSGHDDVTAKLITIARDIAVRDQRVPRRSELRRALAGIAPPAGGEE